MENAASETTPETPTEAAPAPDEAGEDTATEAAISESAQADGNTSSSTPPTESAPVLETSTHQRPGLLERARAFFWTDLDGRP